MVREGEAKWYAPVPPDLSAYKRIYLDTETTGKNPHKDSPVGIAVATEDMKKWYLPFLHAEGGNLDEKIVKRWAKKELVGKDLVFLNAKFDNAMFWRWGIDLEAQENRLHDVSFMPALLNEYRRRFNLEELCQDFLGAGKDRGILKGEKAHIAQMPASVVGPYAETDAIRLKELEDVLVPKIKAEELDRVLSLEDSIIYAVCEMERNGALLDRPKLERWNEELQSKYTKIILEIYQAVGFRVNPNSGDDMARLFRYLGIDPPQTIKGAPSFEGDYLATVQNELVQKALRARRFASLRSKYTKKYLDAIGTDNILRFSLHQLRGDKEGSLKGTISGRFSCAAPSTGGANIQQVTKPDKQLKKFGPGYLIRELFIPEPGKTWVSADASQIEFRLFAHYSDSKKLIKAYQDNPDVDFHQMVLEMVQRVNPDFIRSLAKNVNFAKVYGAGEEKTAEMLSLPIHESNKFVRAYDEEFPEVNILLHGATRLAMRRNYVKTILGRRARFNKPTSTDPVTRRLQEIMYKPHSALNRVLQGSAADILKIKTKEVYDNRKLLELTMRLSVHDEIDGDLANPEKKNKMQELLNEQSIQFKVPLTWDIETGENWALGETA
jgi:DNA polymerase-1